MISEAPTQEDIAGAEMATAQLYEASQSTEDRHQQAQRLHDYSQLLRQSSEALRTRFGRLLYVASLPEVDNGARADLVAVLSECVPAAEGRLTAEDRKMLGAELRALGRLEANAAIRGELVHFASLLQGNTAKP